MAREHSCAYIGAREKRGHFASDYQSIVNSVAFARSQNCDVAIKISQRFIIRREPAIDVIQKVFDDPNVMAATPGRPNVGYNTGAGGTFAAFSILTDIVMIRADAISPEELISLYRERLNREIVQWASFVECAVDELHSRVFNGKTKLVPELTNPSKEDPMFLRRYQASEKQYNDLAKENGFSGRFPLVEWALIERQNYMAKPVIV